MRLREYQRAALQAIHDKLGPRRGIVAHATGLGKAQPLDAPILTPEGWQRMGTIQLGQDVLGADGLPAKVLGVHPRGHMPIVHVKFSDGIVVKCTWDHLWQVQTKSQKARGGDWQVKATSELVADLHDGSNAAKWFVPLTAPVQFKSAPVPIDPYTLGVLLGDGGLRTQIILSSADLEIVDYVRKALPLGMEIVRRHTCDFVIKSKKHRNKVPMREALRELGVFGKYSHEKRIPQLYKYNDVTTRLAVLRGLMDTDGHVRADGHCEFSSTSFGLAKDVAALVRSLGGTTRVRDKKPGTFTHKGKKCVGRKSYRVTVSLPLNPFRLLRKAQAHQPWQKQGRTRAIVSIWETRETKAVQCLTVERALYLTTGYTVTHNTVLAAAWIAEVRARAPTARVLMLAHRDELISQAVARLGQWIPPDSIGVVKAERNETEKPVIVASVQTLAKERRWRSLGFREGRTNPFDACVIDECHHALSPTYQRIIGWLGDFVPTLGLSATPYRSDGKPFDQTWTAGILHEITLLEGIQRGYLADIKTARISLDGKVSWRAKVRRGDFVEADLADCFRAGNGASVIAEAIRTHAQGRPTLVFTPTVATAQETDAACQAAGLTSTCIYGDMLLARRFNGIESFQLGGIQVLTNCAVLTEGFDAPACACVVIARPTRSRSLYLQMLGRGTRKHPDKDHLLVLDLVGASDRHDMESVASAVGLDPWADTERRTVAEAAQKGSLHERIKTPTWQARPYAWVNTNVGYALGLGQDHGTLLIQKHAALGWAIYQLERRKPASFVTACPELEDAQNEAEDLVRRLDADKLARKDEGWRAAKCSPGQREALAKFELGLNLERLDRMRRGEAADLLTKTITELSWRRSR